MKNTEEFMMDRVHQNDVKSNVILMEYSSFLVNPFASLNTAQDNINYQPFLVVIAVCFAFPLQISLDLSV